MIQILTIRKQFIKTFQSSWHLFDRSIVVLVRFIDARTDRWNSLLRENTPNSFLPCCFMPVYLICIDLTNRNCEIITKKEVILRSYILVITGELRKEASELLINFIFITANAELAKYTFLKAVLHSLIVKVFSRLIVTNELSLKCQHFEKKKRSDSYTLQMFLS